MTIALSGTKPFVPASDENALVVGEKGATGVGIAQEEVLGILHKTILRFKDTPVSLADEAGVVAYGSRKIYDAPQGVIVILGSVVNLALTKSSAGVNANWDGDFSLGTAAASNNATLTGTEADILPSTATPQASSGATTATGSGSSAVPTSLTNNTGASADNIVADGLTVTAPAALTVGSDIAAFTDPPSAAEMALLRTFVNALKADVTAIHNRVGLLVTDVTTQNTNDSDLAAKINEILAQQAGGKLLIADGHTTAKDVYFNVLVDDADHDVTGTACNIILNGTITLLWMMIEDF